jgi:NitT/TauT family transport system substrate-binding protein
MKYVSFMHKVGLIKTPPSSWKDLFFPEVHQLQGS